MAISRKKKFLSDLYSGEAKTLAPPEGDSGSISPTPQNLDTDPSPQLEKLQILDIISGLVPPERAQGPNFQEALKYLAAAVNTIPKYNDPQKLIKAATQLLTDAFIKDTSTQPINKDLPDPATAFISNLASQRLNNAAQHLNNATEPLKFANSPHYANRTDRPELQRYFRDTPDIDIEPLAHLFDILNSPERLSDFYLLGY